jgi:hypothetical protein
MDQCDHKSLESSFDSIMVLSAVALFLAGMTLSGFLVANKSEPVGLGDTVTTSTALPIANADNSYEQNTLQPDEPPPTSEPG